jgi:hypothetical protein
MAQEQRHTATPWEIDGVLTIDGVKTKASIYPSFEDDTKTLDAKPIAYIGYEDAAFIVRAVNAHQALVDALQGAIGALEFSRDYHTDLGNEEQAFCQDKLDAALAALKLAEGK